ncbi:MAG TPA: response regulator [Gammaproteobacteria bacterium]|nr:response regulator [Gammaproteobacteria bacterium]
MTKTTQLANPMGVFLARRSNIEVAQAGMRIALGVLITVYLHAANALELGQPLPIGAFYWMYTYLTAAVIIYLHARWRPSTNHPRRVIGILLDVFGGLYLMAVGGELTAWLYGGMLWIAMGNGVRYGWRYLIFAHVLTSVAFAAVLFLNDFWLRNPVAGVGLWVWLLLLPLFVARVLRIFEDAAYVANAANRAKSRFLANMSHEIRTPLTAIIGFAEASLDSDQTMEDRIQALGTIQRSGTHLLTIINDILDFSKIEAGELELESIPVSPFQILTDVAAIVAIQAEQKELAFEVDYQFPIPAEFDSDPVRLRQILLNLCSNAIKFTEQGRIRICMVYCEIEGQLQFIVSDTGIGISAAQGSKIFEPFKQAESGTTRRFGGTGLGLSLSRYLARKLGGDLEFESEVGQGSTFKFRVECPMRNDTQMVHRREDIQVTLGSETGELAVRTPMLEGDVLLVEDNPNNQRLISVLLSKMGARVTVAGNGKEGLELVREREFDMVYMDIQMPVMSGLDAIRAMREEGRTLPVVALTANATSEDQEECFDAGFDEFLTKPVARRQLYEITAHYLKQVDNALTDSSPIVSRFVEEEPDLMDIVVKFVDELPSRLDDLLSAYEQRNWDDLKDRIHNLKGMGGGFGYPQVTDLAGKIEFEVRSGNYQNVRHLLKELADLCKRIGEGIDTDHAA